MARLLIFNCSNDMALASGASEYVPPKSVAQMEAIYYKVPMFVADDGDIALSPQELSLHGGFQHLQESLHEPITEVLPWGWSRPIRNKLLRYGVPPHMLPNDNYLESLRQLSSRQFGAEYAKQFYAMVGEGIVRQHIVEDKMQFVTCAEDLHLDEGAYIAKLPWSSSGRGNKIFTITDTSIVPVNKYPVLIDRYYDKVIDFAMEFMIQSDSVDYLGLSVFEASKEGRYAFNYVESQAALTSRIQSAMQLTPDETTDLLLSIRHTHQSLLTNTLQGRYHGPLGIDMMVVTDNASLREPQRELSSATAAIHPTVELNLRMNMGIMSILSYQKHGNQYPRLTLQTVADNC